MPDRKMFACRLPLQALVEVDLLAKALQRRSPGKVSQADAIAWAVARGLAEIEALEGAAADAQPRPAGGASKVGSLSSSAWDELYGKERLVQVGVLPDIRVGPEVAHVRVLDSQGRWEERLIGRGPPGPSKADRLKAAQERADQLAERRAKKAAQAAAKSK